MDGIQLVFMNWVSLYHDVMTNLIGDEKEEAKLYIEDDYKFDQWLKRLDAKHKGKAPSGNKKYVDKDTFFKKTAGRLPNPGRRNG